MLVAQSKYKNTEQLVVSLKNKEVEAFEFLYDQFSTKLYQFILLSLPKTEAEQVLENCFINIWHQIDHYNFNGQFYTWIVAATKTEISKALIEQKERQKKIDKILKELFCTRNVFNTPVTLVREHGF